MSENDDIAYNIISYIVSSEDDISEIIDLLSKDVDIHDERFIHILYGLYGLFLENNDINIRDLIKNRKYEWESPCFDTQRLQIQEQDDFIENPFEVMEGVLECKCGSKRVFSYTKQTRSADEPMTTFAECAVCKSKWTMKG